MSKFLKDMEKIIKKSQKRLSKRFNEIKTGKYSSETKELLSILDLEETEENVYATLVRYISLKENNLKSVFKKLELSDTEIEEKLRLSYKFVVSFYKKENKKLLKQIKSLNSVSKLDMAVIELNLNIGKRITKVYKKWLKELNKMNQSLVEEFGSDENILEFMKQNNLFDQYKGKDSDHCYSILKKTKNGYKVETYGQMFKNEMTEIKELIEEFTSDKKLKLCPDYIVWKDYLNALSDAFIEEDRNKVIELWAIVDKKWMKITSPVQYVHPIEYYEDKYRNAVSIEFDIRIKVPGVDNNTTGETIKKLFNENLPDKYIDIKELVETNIDLVQLHITNVLFFSGNQYKGLFSAQVIPNDEEVSEKYGKKIFALIDKGYESMLAAPKKLISKKIFGKKVMKVSRQKLKNKELYEKIYDITTIGHEYGHVLWKDKDTEKDMNEGNGLFKNVEEFKASGGGIVAFFDSDLEDKYWESVYVDTIQRAVNLIAWKENQEVVPYYCEALITLTALFDSKTLTYDKKSGLSIDFSKDTYEVFKKEYKKIYLDDIVKNYLNKSSVPVILNNYCKKEEDGYFYPINKNIKEFVNYYYELYEEIGNVIIK